jgi:pSer/pThr/pTyr-binding forkhead associated (FHA) protein
LPHQNRCPMMPTIVLNLLNSIPVQSWKFVYQDPIGIGRATDNNVVLFSAVVSRYHAQLRWNESTGWQIVNISSNGTYLDNRPIQTVDVTDGMTIRLAASGPKIQISLVSSAIADEIAPSQQQAPS